MYHPGTLISAVMIKNACFEEFKYEEIIFLFLLKDSCIEPFFMTGLAALVLAVQFSCSLQATNMYKAVSNPFEETAFLRRGLNGCQQ